MLRQTLQPIARVTVPEGREPTLLPILSVAFVGSLGFSIVLPLLVFVVTSFGGNALVYGALGATYALFQLFGAPVLGRLSDQYGRRIVLLTSQLGTLLSWLLFLWALYLPVSTVLEVSAPGSGTFALTLPLAVLFLARAFDGLTGGNVSVANAYLADVTTEKERTSAYGKMAVATNLGFVLGPAIAGLLGGAEGRPNLPVMAAAAISVVATGIIYFGLRDVDPCTISGRLGETGVDSVLGQEHKECYTVSDADAVSLADALRPAAIRVLLLVHFLVFLAFNFFYISFPVHAATTLAWSLTEVGVFFSVLGLLMAVVQGPVLGAVAKRLERRTLVLIGSPLLAGGFALYTSDAVVTIYAAAALVALGNGLMWPSLLAMLSTAAGRRAQGTVQGFASSSASVASIVGLLVGGLLYDRLTDRVFLVAAVITGVAALTAMAIARPRHAPEDVGPAALRSSLVRRSRRGR